MFTRNYSFCDLNIKTILKMVLAMVVVSFIMATSMTQAQTYPPCKAGSEGGTLPCNWPFDTCYGPSPDFAPTQLLVTKVGPQFGGNQCYMFATITGIIDETLVPANSVMTAVGSNGGSPFVTATCPVGQGPPFACPYTSLGPGPTTLGAIWVYDGDVTPAGMIYQFTLVDQYSTPIGCIQANGASVNFGTISCVP